MWRNNSDELPFQMTFGGQTVVQRVNSKGTIDGPMFQSIQLIPRILIPGTKYDVLGIVLYVEDKVRIINANQGREFHVKEIVITDQTMGQPLVITTWNDLADNACDAISLCTKTFDVIGFTALRPYVHKACGKRIDIPVGTEFSCANCKKKDSISAYRSAPEVHTTDSRMVKATKYQTADDIATVNSLLELSQQQPKRSCTEAHLTKIKDGVKDWNPIISGNFAQTDSTVHGHLA
uniref:Replication protein A OB domain-containing protein n=1 Tax=Chenopodium quinoa TaxID=63459 RepID=A0A803MPT6_CHEQI